jgi:transcriptional regulator with XRE-family HTH domain
MKKFLRISLGESIRSKRKELGLSQQELANRCGLHRAFISIIELGDRSTNSANLYNIALALETSIASLFIEVDIEIAKELEQQKKLYKIKLLEDMNLTNNFISDKIDYKDIVRIYEFFKSNPDNSKRYLYYHRYNDHLDITVKNHIWRKRNQDSTFIGMYNIGQFREESKRVSMCMHTIATY